MYNPIKIYQGIMSWIFGNPENVDKPLKWYHYLNLLAKAITPIAAIVFLYQKQYFYGIICVFAVGVDVWMYHSLMARYLLYKESEVIKDKGKVGNIRK
jgi:hypothetical protein